jgi:hypothetical protein
MLKEINLELLADSTKYIVNQIFIDSFGKFEINLDDLKIYTWAEINRKYPHINRFRSSLIENLRIFIYHLVDLFVMALNSEITAYQLAEGLDRLVAYFPDGKKPQTNYDELNKADANNQ